MVSVIIPARNEIYLYRTVLNILENAKGEIEIIVELDGYLPNSKIDVKDERVIFVHHEKQIGQRACINHGARIAKGKFIMKLDAHCAVDKGFDVILAQDCEYDWTVIPRMYNLDHVTWLPKRHKKTDYMYIGCSEGRVLRAEYYGSKQPKNDLLIDDIMCCMGPCFFMHKKRFIELEGCDENHEGGWGQQGVEVSCKAWLSGGSLKVNKKTWFAHWFRGGGGPGFPYPASGRQHEKVRKYSRDLWLNSRWHKQTREFQWLVDKFNPPGWNDKKSSSQWSYIQGKTFNVQDMYKNRKEFCDPRKRNSLNWFMKCFPVFLIDVSCEKTFTNEQLEEYDYYKYLVERLNPADQNPLTKKGKRHVMNQMRQAKQLFFDIKENGLRNPLDVWRSGKSLILQRGYRRLEMLYLLGQKTVAVRIFKTKEAFKLHHPEEMICKKPDSIHSLGMKQFQKLQDKATDKYWVHDYLRLYDTHIGRFRESIKKVLEIGVYRGASLLLWKQSFPNAEIFGIDKNTAVWQEFLSNQDKIKVFVGRQEDSKFLADKVKPEGDYDLIIDDGGHLPKSTQTSFSELWGSVASGGWYVVEDLFGNYRKDKIRETMMEILKGLIDKMNLKGEIQSLHFYYNICFIQKKGK